MARLRFNVALGAGGSNGSFATRVSSDTPGDTTTAAADAATAKTATALTVTDAALAVTASGVVDTDAGLADTAAGTVAADDAAVEAAIAVLEADGATPTQAHVNSLRTVWNTLVAAITAAKTATALVVTKSALNVTAVGLANTKAGLADTAVAAVVADLGAVGGDAGVDALLDIDASVLDTANKRRAAIDALLTALNTRG